MFRNIAAGARIRGEMANATSCALNLSHAEWKTYFESLYGTSVSNLQAAVDQLDVVNLTLLHDLSASARAYARWAASVLPRKSWDCPIACSKGMMTFVGNLNVHCPLEFAWRWKRMERHNKQVTAGGGFTALPNQSWAEVTHCGGSNFESRGAFFYAARGSGLWMPLGRTASFGTHEDAVRRLLGHGCRDSTRRLAQCSADLAAMLAAASLLDLDTLQFTRHCDARCGHCLHEIVSLRGDGRAPCPQGVDFRRGARAERPCTCVPHSSSVGSHMRPHRGACATCASLSASLGLTTPPLRRTRASLGVHGLEASHGEMPPQQDSSTEDAMEDAVCAIERTRAQRYLQERHAHDSSVVHLPTDDDLSGSSLLISRQEDEAKPSVGNESAGGDGLAPRRRGTTSTHLSAQLAWLLRRRGTLCSSSMWEATRSTRAGSTAVDGSIAGSTASSTEGGGACIVQAVGDDLRVCLQPPRGFDTLLQRGGLLCQTSPAFVEGAQGSTLVKACARGTTTRCFDFNESAILSWVDALRTRVGALRRAYALRRATSRTQNIAARLPDTSEPPHHLLRGRLRRCAVVLSGHTLRCARRSWEGLLDSSYYDAVWRTNVYPSTELGGVGGRRTDVAYRSCERAPRSASCLTEEWLDTSGLGPRPMKPRLQGTGLGIGHSGGTLVGVAIASCERVDVFGAGLFSRGPGHDVVYQHHYDMPLVAECTGPCLHDPAVHPDARSNLTAAELRISRQLCQPSDRCKGHQKGLPPSESLDDFFFLSELRLPILHVLRLINWVWY